MHVLFRHFERLLSCCCLAMVGAGCAGFPQTPPVTTPPAPLFVSGLSDEEVWERVIDVLHDYPFAIARENKLNGVIETEYKVGANLLEPWHRDSVGLWNRLESGLQPIRRKVFVTITPSNNGFGLAVRAEKEISDRPQRSANTPGGATFQDNLPLRRDLDAVVGERPQSAGWVSRGRDFALEHDLTQRLQAAFGVGPVR